MGAKFCVTICMSYQHSATGGLGEGVAGESALHVIVRDMGLPGNRGILDMVLLHSNRNYSSYLILYLLLQAIQTPYIFNFKLHLYLPSWVKYYLYIIWLREAFKKKLKASLRANDRQNLWNRMTQISLTWQLELILVIHKKINETRYVHQNHNSIWLKSTRTYPSK